MTREEHLAWAKARALEYVEIGDLNNALASLVSDLNKHAETRGHPGVALGMNLTLAGHMKTPEQMREWIEGFR